jgi:hypothetical protein
MRAQNATVVGALFVILVGCSGQKQLKKEDVRSELISAISLAADTELFIDRVRQGATSESFQHAHVEYLQEQLKDSIKDLEKIQPEPDAADAAAQCRDGFEKLGQELSGVSAANDDRLSTARNRVEDIRRALERAKASL